MNYLAHSHVFDSLTLYTAPKSKVVAFTLTPEGRFNTNKTSYSCSIDTGVLKWQDIDDEYAISFVFKGNFGRQLCQESRKAPYLDGKNPRPIKVISDEPNLHFFVAVAPPKAPIAEFYLSLTEDPVAGVGVEVSDGLSD